MLHLKIINLVSDNSFCQVMLSSFSWLIESQKKTSHLIFLNTVYTCNMPKQEKKKRLFGVDGL